MIEYWCGECEVCGNDLYCDEHGNNVTCFICKEFEEDDEGRYDCGCCKCCGCDCDEEVAE